MVSKQWKAPLFAAASMAMILANAVAQVPNGVSHEASPLAAPQGRFTMMHRLGLYDPTLRLTPTQWAEIDKVISAYLAEQEALALRLAGKDAPPSQAVMAARREARDGLAVKVGNVLDHRQREIWDAAQAAVRRTQTDSARQHPGIR